MTGPVRIQRKRTAGWKMPPNTVYVGRPSRFGNPFHAGQDGDHERCVYLHRVWIQGRLPDSDIRALFAQPSADWLINVRDYRRDSVRELRGKNLCCWCKESEPCHADVLLEIANSEVRLRTEHERLDRRLTLDASPHSKWSSVEKDDTRGRALPEHMEAHAAARSTLKAEGE